MARLKVFLDSSVLIAALLSSRGGSFYILTALREKFDFFISEYVFEEVVMVLEEKFSGREDMKNNFFFLLDVTPIKILKDPSKENLKPLRKFLEEKDVPILASALESSSYLLSLDNEFFGEALLNFSMRRGLAIIKPKEFIERFKD